jgi:hypothetical protein
MLDVANVAGSGFVAIFCEAAIIGYGSQTSKKRSKKKQAVRCDEAGPSHQGSVVQNASLEASLRNRVQRLERDRGPFLLDKGKGEYWEKKKS